MTPANDNQPRSPEQHRRILAEQATTGERASRAAHGHKAGVYTRLASLCEWTWEWVAVESLLEAGLGDLLPWLAARGRGHLDRSHRGP